MTEPYHRLMAKEWLKLLVGARGAAPGGTGMEIRVFDDQGGAGGRGRRGGRGRPPDRDALARGAART